MKNIKSLNYIKRNESTSPMKCIKCGKEAGRYRTCDTCKQELVRMRKTIFYFLFKKYGQIGNNLKVIQKEFKLLEWHWRRDEQKAIEKMKQEDLKTFGERMKPNSFKP
jgi:hypothetical protein